MDKIVCKRIENLPFIYDLEGLFSIDIDASYCIGMPLITETNKCNFLNPILSISDELKHNTLTILNPYNWTKESMWKKIHIDRFQSIAMNVLHNAHIFGGRIMNRDSIYHNSGQLLLTCDYSILNASLGVLDGSNTLPRDLIECVDNKFYLNSKPYITSDFLPGDYYFIGSIHHHFGHFLVEGLSRLWGIKYIPEHIKENLKFIIYEESIKPYALSILKKFGVNLNNIVFAPKHANVERVFVPDISYKTHYWGSSLQADVYNQLMEYTFKDVKKSKYIYLSRSNVPDRPLSNERDLECKLKCMGFEIVHPELLDIETQISIMKGAEIIVGPVGSQMYLSAFSAATTNVVICAPSNFYLPDDLLIASIKNLNLHVLLGSDIDYSQPKRNRNWNIHLEKFCDYIYSLI